MLIWRWGTQRILREDGDASYFFLFLIFLFFQMGFPCFICTHCQKFCFQLTWFFWHIFWEKCFYLFLFKYFWKTICVFSILLDFGFFFSRLFREKCFHLFLFKYFRKTIDFGFFLFGTTINPFGKRCCDFLIYFDLFLVWPWAFLILKN